LRCASARILSFLKLPLAIGTTFRIELERGSAYISLAQLGGVGHINRKKEIIMHDKPVALVTGANQGIGLQIAKELAAKNLTVLVGSRDYARGQEAAKTIDGDACPLQIDVTDSASIAAAAERIRKELDRLDVLVNNAAIARTGRLLGATIR